MSVDLDEQRRLGRARDQMDREYAQPLDVPALAHTAMMSPAHFSRRFRAAYSETPYSYLMSRRIERAKELLRRGELSVTEVCMAVGARHSARSQPDSPSSSVRHQGSIGPATTRCCEPCLVVGSDAGPFTDPDGFAWEACMRWAYTST